MAPVYFHKEGSGSPLILIHGFPLNREVWNSFSKKLADTFTVYTPDLPGFGKSPLPPAPFSIDSVADVIISWMEDEPVTKPALIGHSLGGYVALAVARKRPELLQAFGLFHSTAFADTEEKKQSRNKVLEFVDKNGALAFTSNFVSTLFNDPQHPAVEKVRDLGIQASAEAVKGYTAAMRDRPDRTDVLTGFAGPVLFIAGEKDKGIPVEDMNRQAAICKHADLNILVNTAHMGMFENETKAIEIIRSFLEKAWLPH